MTRPSDPLLHWLRQRIQSRNLNVAAVAEKAGLDRQRARRVLAGNDAMTVDELLKITEALALTPAEMGLPADAKIEEAAPAAPAATPAAEDPYAPLLAALDPYGNQPEQLFRIAFHLGCNFYFHARTADLGDSGVPKRILEHYRGGDIILMMDAAYHQHNNPRYAPLGITVTLSFDDGLYDCTFPWSSITQVRFYPATPATPEVEEEEDDPTPDPGRPRLRLVT